MSMPEPEANQTTFCWRHMPEAGARVEHPALRQPISLIIDDPMPGYNPSYFHLGLTYGPEFVPVSLVDDFADLVERTGLRGKFSIVPYPCGFGRVDREVQGVSDADRRYFLDVVRERIAPFLDITPEALTHWNALDLKTWQLLPYWEHVWSRRQTTETLVPYLSLGLEILNNVNLPSRGHTSPWDFGEGVEDQYAAAVLEAQRRVNGRDFTWYFLQLDATAPSVQPRLSILDAGKAQAVVSVVVCDSHDFGAPVWRGGEPDLDMLITEDGQAGRLVETLRNGGSTAFHSHWQTMFSRGTQSGLRALETICARIATHFGDRVAWTTCDDLARYAATAAAVSGAPAGASSLRLSTPFACPRFTLSVAPGQPVRAVYLDEKPLAHAQSPLSLEEGTWIEHDNRVVACWRLEGEQTLRWEPAGG